jgi:hypothetical protein
MTGSMDLSPILSVNRHLPQHICITTVQGWPGGVSPSPSQMRALRREMYVLKVVQPIRGGQDLEAGHSGSWACQLAAQALKVAPGTKGRIVWCHQTLT